LLLIVQDKSKSGNEDKDDIWWDRRGSKGNKHVPVKDPNSPPPKTGNFLTPTAGFIAGSKPKYEVTKEAAAKAVKPPAHTKAISMVILFQILKNNINYKLLQIEIEKYIIYIIYNILLNWII
jgi:hypothetical protein